eukprot:1460472-Alexandrium_andersonii.AAC.1
MARRRVLELPPAVRGSAAEPRPASQRATQAERLDRRSAGATETATATATATDDGADRRMVTARR